MLLCNETFMERKVSCTLFYFIIIFFVFHIHRFCCKMYVFSHFRYNRIFSIGTHGITTYNCNMLEITNRWLYEDIVSIRALQQQHEFTITMKKGKDKKHDTMRFSTVHRSHVLSDALKYRNLFAERRLESFVSTFDNLINMKIYDKYLRQFWRRNVLNQIRLLILIHGNVQEVTTRRKSNFKFLDKNAKIICSFFGIKENKTKKFNISLQFSKFKFFVTKLISLNWVLILWKLHFYVEFILV